LVLRWGFFAAHEVNIKGIAPKAARESLSASFKLSVKKRLQLSMGTKARSLAGVKASFMTFDQNLFYRKS
jgi:hypothetical protein